MHACIQINSCMHTGCAHGYSYKCDTCNYIRIISSYIVVQLGRFIIKAIAIIMESEDYIMQEECSSDSEELICFPHTFQVSCNLSSGTVEDEEEVQYTSARGWAYVILNNSFDGSFLEPILVDSPDESVRSPTPCAIKLAIASYIV